MRIGAAVSGATLSECQYVRDNWPGILEALELIGSTQIQVEQVWWKSMQRLSCRHYVPAMISNGAIY